ncbi:MAG: hypothetical protein M1424_02450 [Candidatus Thermoplasmatota archaeon]|nr:hypothetical protein [Candidatus Thermoplasmatota archaeon]
MEKDDLTNAKKKAEKKMDSFIRSMNIEAGKMSQAITDGNPGRTLIDLANSSYFDAVPIGHRG